MVNLINNVFFWFTVVHSARDAVKSRRPLSCCVPSIGNREQRASSIPHQGVHKQYGGAENQSWRAIVAPRASKVSLQWLGKFSFLSLSWNLWNLIVRSHKPNLHNYSMIDHCKIFFAAHVISTILSRQFVFAQSQRFNSSCFPSHFLKAKKLNSKINWHR